MHLQICLNFEIFLRTKISVKTTDRIRIEVIISEVRIRQQISDLDQQHCCDDTQRTTTEVLFSQQNLIKPKISSITNFKPKF